VVSRQYEPGKFTAFITQIIRYCTVCVIDPELVVKFAGGT
jgi:hypothetical protein